MKKLIASVVLLASAGLGITACSGGNGTPFCNKSRDLVKAIGTTKSPSVGQGKLAVAAYRAMANNIPKDLKGVTKKDLDDVATVAQATYVDKSLAAIDGKVDRVKFASTVEAIQAYNVKHCDIVYKK